MQLFNEYCDMLLVTLSIIPGLVLFLVVLQLDVIDRNQLN